jgi:hypothetical protein
MMEAKVAQFLKKNFDEEKLKGPFSLKVLFEKAFITYTGISLDEYKEKRFDCVKEKQMREFMHYFLRIYT